MGMDQYLLIPFLGGYSHPFISYFDVNRRGTIGFDTLPYNTSHHEASEAKMTLVS